MITTMKERWDQYRSACYPDGCSAVQEKECRQAFYSGALSLFAITTSEVTELSDDDGAKALEVISREIEAACREYVKSNFSRSN